MTEQLSVKKSTKKKITSKEKEKYLVTNNKSDI